MRAHLVSLVLAAACGTPQAPPPVAPEAALEAAPTAPEEPKDPSCGCEEEMDDLSTRLGRVELLVGDMQQNGIYQADKIIYNPGQSGLGAHSVQGALDELAHQARPVDPGLGAPSPALFDPNIDAGGPLPPGTRPPGQQSRPGTPPGGPGGQPGGPPGGPPPGGGGPQGGTPPQGW